MGTVASMASYPGYCRGMKCRCNSHTCTGSTPQPASAPESAPTASEDSLVETWLKKRPNVTVVVVPVFIGGRRLLGRPWMRMFG
jgi:hypothetical protein